MDLKGLEKYLAANNYDSKPVTGGVLINLGALVGRVHVKYDETSKTMSFNDKSRWITQSILALIMLFFLTTNFNVYSQLQLYSCIAVTIGMFLIFWFKEKKITALKQALEAAGASQGAPTKK
ncbi:hypothetical protein [Enterovibrio norvegicus]|uniref:Uncharacterized protein n=1 Tax=Enterovibrio norvegicus TaxID=188144 RepID=A0ABV4KYC8_9GAMM